MKHRDTVSQSKQPDMSHANRFSCYAELQISVNSKRLRYMRFREVGETKALLPCLASATTGSPRREFSSAKLEALTPGRPARFCRCLAVVGSRVGGIL